MGIEQPQQKVFDPAQMDPAEITTALQTMKASLGWQIITHVLRHGELAVLNKELKDKNFETLAEVQNLQYKISLVEQLLDLPDNLYQQYIEGSDESGEDDAGDDPYYQKSEDIKNDLLKEEEDSEVE